MRLRYFLSHKASRLALPWAILLVGAGTLALDASPWRSFLLIAEAGVAALALVDAVLPRGFPLKFVTSPARTFLSMNAAALLSTMVFFVHDFRAAFPATDGGLFIYCFIFQAPNGLSNTHESRHRWRVGTRARHWSALLGHPGVELPRSRRARTRAGRLRRSSRRSRDRPGVVFTASDPAALAAGDVPLFFLALPHGAAAEFARALVGAGKRVIDLSADFRVADLATYERYYGKHHAPELLPQARYVLPELTPPGWKDGAKSSLRRDATRPAS